MRALPSMLLAASTALAGCVHMQSIEAKTASVDPKAGYVGGAFNTSGGAAGYGFAIVDPAGKRWFLPFADPGGNGQRYTDGKMVGLIALPPGDYRVGAWVKSTFDSKGKEIPSTDSLGRPFTVQPGHVVFLGSFNATKTATSSGNVITTHFSITPVALRADEVVTTVAAEYPAFADAAIECVLCTAPPAGAVKYAKPAPRAVAADVWH